MWLERAARLAVSRYEIDDALVMLERALELEDDPQRQGRLWRIVGRANALRHDGEPFLDAMMRAIELRLHATTSGGALRRALLRDRDALRHVAPTTGA